MFGSSDSGLTEAGFFLFLSIATKICSLNSLISFDSFSFWPTNFSKVLSLNKIWFEFKKIVK